MISYCAACIARFWCFFRNDAFGQHMCGYRGQGSIGDYPLGFADCLEAKTKYYANDRFAHYGFEAQSAERERTFWRRKI